MLRRTILVVALSLGRAGSAVAATIVGTSAPDVLRGTAKADVLRGGAGNDVIYGFAGKDTIYPGPGRDRVFCGTGVDHVFADAADVVAKDCEIVSRPAAAKVTPKPSTPPTPVTPPPPPAPVGSQKNPVPLGQSASVANGWRIQVTGVAADATAAVLATNQFNDPPAAGSQFFMIAVSATYSGTGSSHLDPGFSMRAVGRSAVGYTTFNNSCGVLPEPNLYIADPETFTGGTVNGNAACWAIVSSDAA